MRKRFIVAITFAAALIAASPAAPAPYVPADDAVVLERLPEKGDPALAQLKKMRAGLAAMPRNLDFATLVAKRAIEAARETGDPRFLGQAQAALSPWWNDTAPPSAALLLRATLKQSQHDFEGAITDLNALLSQRPGDGQALLTRATVFTVRGRYAEARSDCARLGRMTTPLVLTTCTAAPASLSGEASASYRALQVALDNAREDPGVREWALTLSAEIAARRGDLDAAGRDFRAALALDARDAYLKGAYADYLLDAHRPAKVVGLLRDDTRNDSLLLRLALAEQALPDQAAAFAAHRAELAARFDAAHRRGDSLHRREEARFRLFIENDAAAALVLAQDNWKVQREPADLRVLAEAARAANDAGTTKVVAEWMASARVEDARVAATLEATR